MTGLAPDGALVRPGLAIGLAALISGCGGIFSDTPHRPLYQLKPR